MTARTLALLCLLLMPLLGLAQEKPRLDKHGYPLPDGAIARLGNLRFVAPGSANVLALSPDGKRLASIGQRIFISNADTGKIIRQIKIPERSSVRLLAWSNDGRLLASLDSEAILSIWNADTGRLHWPEPNTVRQIENKKTYITALRFGGNDGRLVIVAAPTYPSSTHFEFSAGSKYAFEPPGWRVELWDVATGELSSVWTVDQAKQAALKALGEGYGFCYVALSSNGERMAWLASRPREAAEGKSTVFVYDTVTGKLLHTVKDLPRSYHVDLPDEGETLVVHPVRPAKMDKITVRKGVVVNIPDGRVRFHYDYRFVPLVYRDPWEVIQKPGRVFRPRSAVCYRDSLLTRDGLGMIRWDLKSGKKLEEFNQKFRGFTVSANGQRIAIGEGRYLRISAGDLASLHTEGNYPNAPSLRFLPDGRLLGWDGYSYGSGQYGRLVQVWDPHKGTVLESLQLHPWPSDASANMETDLWGKRLIYSPRGEESFVVHDLVTNEQLYTLKREGYSLLPSDDGKRLLLYAREEDRLVVRWFDARNGKELGRYEIPYQELHVRALEVQWFSEDGSVFGFITPDHRLALVNCAEKKIKALVGMSPNKGSKYPVWRYRSIGFDRLLYAGPSDYLSRTPEYAVWDRHGQLLRRYSMQLGDNQWAGLSHDGRFATVHLRKKGEIAFYETATGRRRGEFKFPQDYYYHSAAISPDGKLLGTASLDTTILLWDLARPLSGKAELPPPKTAKEAEKLWDLLGDPDPQESDLALSALVKAPKQTLALMKQRLQPARAPDPKLLQQLIDHLDSANFSKREKASKDLKNIGDTALPALREALKKPASLEQRQRLEKLIPPLEETVTVEPCLRELRALEVLERLGTAEARKLVAAVAAGAEGALLTAEARLVLERWQKTTAGP